MLIDSSVLVDFIRGEEKAKDYLVGLSEIKFSRISWMELVFGAKSKENLLQIKRQLMNLGSEVVEMTGEISQLAGEVLERYRLSDGIGVADALIVATAMSLDKTLVTHNAKHFRFVKGLDLIVPY